MKENYTSTRHDQNIVCDGIIMLQEKSVMNIMRFGGRAHRETEGL